MGLQAARLHAGQWAAGDNASSTRLAAGIMAYERPGRWCATCQDAGVEEGTSRRRRNESRFRRVTGASPWLQFSELCFRDAGLRTVGLWADIGSISARSRPDFGAGGSAGNRRNLPPRNQAEIEPKSSRYRPKVPQYEVPQSHSTKSHSLDLLSVKQPFCISIFGLHQEFATKLYYNWSTGLILCAFCTIFRA